MSDFLQTDGTVAVSAPIGVATGERLSVGLGLPSWGRMLGLWIARWSTRAELAELEPCDLADLGLTEHARHRECGKRFWQP